MIENKKILRKFRALSILIPAPSYFYYNFDFLKIKAKIEGGKFASHLAMLEKRLRVDKEDLNNLNKWASKRYLEENKNISQFLDCARKLELTLEEFESLWYKFYIEIHSLKDEYKCKPIKAKKDNNGEYVGSGGENKNKIRYPSLKRSKRVWKKFYELFPKAEKRKSI